MKFPILTLLTDFGLEDAYVGTMKGVILSINPAARIIDICHQIAAQDVFEGAYVLWTSYQYLPKGTVHVAVVDPGVGGKRKAICSRINDHVFVVPDNGLLSFVAADSKPEEVVEITQGKYLLPAVSRTFHGRDVFAPAAAHVSKGLPIRRLGRRRERIQMLSIPRPETSEDGRIRGEVIHIDKFGNLVTNIPDKMLPGKKTISVSVGTKRIHGTSPSYDAVPSGKLLAIVGSARLLEISVNGGNAARFLRAKRGKKVWVTTT